MCGSREGSDRISLNSNWDYGGGGSRVRTSSFFSGGRKVKSLAVPLIESKECDKIIELASAGAAMENLEFTLFP